jgi:hypothetical protein
LDQANFAKKMTSIQNTYGQIGAILTFNMINGQFDVQFRAFNSREHESQNHKSPMQYNLLENYLIQLLTSLMTASVKDNYLNEKNGNRCVIL